MLFAQTKLLEKIYTVLLTFDFEWEEVQNMIHPHAIKKMKPWPRPRQCTIRKLNHNNRWPDVDDLVESKFLRKSIQDLQDTRLIDLRFSQSTFLKWNVFWALIRDRRNPRLTADPDPAFWTPPRTSQFVYRICTRCATHEPTLHWENAGNP